MIRLFATGIFALLIMNAPLVAQDEISFTERGSYAWSPQPPYSTYTALFHADGLPFLYTACAELGVVTLNIEDPDNPVPIDTITVAAFNGLKVQNIAIHENLLLVAAGGIQGVSQAASLAVVDLSNPADPTILDQWIAPESTNGAAVVTTNGQFAFLGAMEEGIYVLDIGEPEDISLATHFLPDPNFPTPPGPFTQPNARGMDLRNDTLYLCLDSKGFRMIDVTDPFNPQEVGKHMNAEVLTNSAPAYNEVVVVDNYAYATIDFCGIEVIDISDTIMQTVNWINPWDCGLDWACSPGHTNQIRLSGDSLLFVSGADTELFVLDITDRENPEIVGTFGAPFDLSVTWGVGIRDNLAALAHVHFPYECGGIVPYESDWGGIKLLEWDNVLTSGLADRSLKSIAVYPNPATEFIQLTTGENERYKLIQIRDIRGMVVMELDLNNRPRDINVDHLTDGVYNISVWGDSGIPLGRSQFIKVSR